MKHELKIKYATKPNQATAKRNLNESNRLLK